MITFGNSTGLTELLARLEAVEKQRDLANARLAFLEIHAWRIPAEWGTKPASWHISLSLPGDDSVHDKLPHDFLAAVDKCRTRPLR
jgi:hypothetical protein